jgi:hypothetical protein
MGKLVDRLYICAMDVPSLEEASGETRAIYEVSWFHERSVTPVNDYQISRLT